MNDDEIQDEREMTLEEKKRLREILGFGLSAALPLAYNPEDDAATIARLTAELDAAQKTIAHWESHDFEDDIDDATAEMSGQLAEASADNQRLTAELSAMTERRDTLLRIVRAYRSELIDYVTEKVNDDEVNAMYSTPDEEIKRNFIRWFSRKRRETRND